MARGILQLDTHTQVAFSVSIDQAALPFFDKVDSRISPAGVFSPKLEGEKSPVACHPSILHHQHSVEEARPAHQVFRMSAHWGE